MKPLYCDQPQDDEPRLLCPDTAVYGTTRCVRHQAPKTRTVVIRSLVPLTAEDRLLGELPPPPGWTACGCGNCPNDVPDARKPTVVVASATPSNVAAAAIEAPAATATASAESPGFLARVLHRWGLL